MASIKTALARKNLVALTTDFRNTSGFQFETSLLWPSIAAVRLCGGLSDVRFGSQAAPLVNISLMAAFAWKAEVKISGNQDFEGPESAQNRTFFDSVRSVPRRNAGKTLSKQKLNCLDFLDSRLIVRHEIAR